MDRVDLKENELNEGAGLETTENTRSKKDKVNFTFLHFIMEVIS